MHGVARFKLTCHIRCSYMRAVFVPLIVHYMKCLKIWVMWTKSVIPFCLCAHVCVYTCLCTCQTVCVCVCVGGIGICSVSTAPPLCSAKLSPSPGCNSNWLNLPGKLRGWLEAPSNYLTEAKPGVKNRFSCSFILPFCNKVKICCQKELHSSQLWRMCNLCNLMLPLAHTKYQKLMSLSHDTKILLVMHVSLPSIFITPLLIRTPYSLCPGIDPSMLVKVHLHCCLFSYSLS